MDLFPIKCPENGRLFFLFPQTDRVKLDGTIPLLVMPHTYQQGKCAAYFDAVACFRIPPRTAKHVPGTDETTQETIGKSHLLGL